VAESASVPLARKIYPLKYLHKEEWHNGCSDRGLFGHGKSSRKTHDDGKGEEHSENGEQEQGSTSETIDVDRRGGGDDKVPDGCGYRVRKGVVMARYAVNSPSPELIKVILIGSLIPTDRKMGAR
jgi:hypothetical protein